MIKNKAMKEEYPCAGKLVSLMEDTAFEGDRVTDRYIGHLLSQLTSVAVTNEMQLPLIQQNGTTHVLLKYPG